MDYYAPPPPASFDPVDPEDPENPLDLSDPPPVVAPTLPTILPAPFISPAELATHIYASVSDAIADGDATLLPAAIAAATQEAMGYISRFDYVTILSETGATRDPILLQYVKDMAAWHFIVLANPNIDYEVRMNRYKYAIRWLEKIQDGKFVPAGWPVATTPDLATYFHLTSQPKRGNNY